jgi:AcrR family transcriptional regulator
MPAAKPNLKVKRSTNRERILTASIELFNQAGVVAVTTNHIAAHLGISPGNLYFHFRNKEEIMLELFDRMCAETYEVWMPNKKLGAYDSPLDLIERSFEVYWNFRFFHREMYHLRRKDPALARKWKSHMNKTVRLLTATYSHWVKIGAMKRIDDKAEMQMVSDIVLITSSSFLHFYESPDKPATRRSVRQGVDHILRLLLPYHAEEKRTAVIERLRA